MDARQQRGLVIAATMKIRQRDSVTFICPSQTVNQGSYTVDVLIGRCTCADFEERQLPCKHLHAVTYFMSRETVTLPSGETRTTETHGVRLTTYPQPWAAYNQAQTSEKDAFCTLLRDLCAGIPSPEQTRGRPRLPLGDMVFAAGFKVYSTMSTRRFSSDLRAAAAGGLIDKAPHYNSVIRTMESAEVTPILHELITASSLPLREVEVDFAIDSTGFSSSQTYGYRNMKYGTAQRHEWVKAHAMVGVKTNVVTAVRVTDRNGGDSPQLPALLADTARNFTIKQVSGDKAYNSRANFDLIARAGAEPFIPFKSNARFIAGSVVWDRAFHLFAYNRPAFLAHYHKRSNVEATFSMIKRVFGDAVRSKTPVARENEVLLKVLAHNVRCLIHATHELGIDPTFGCPNNQKAASEVGVA